MYVAAEGFAFAFIIFLHCAYVNVLSKTHTVYTIPKFPIIVMIYHVLVYYGVV